MFLCAVFVVKVQKLGNSNKLTDVVIVIRNINSKLAKVRHLTTPYNTEKMASLLKQKINATNEGPAHILSQHTLENLEICVSLSFRSTQKLDHRSKLTFLIDQTKPY